MKLPTTVAVSLLAALTADAALAQAASAPVNAPPATPSAGETRIYQQRDADGRIVLTDRPVPGAVTQRTWDAKPADPADAERRETARQDAEAVSNRIQRRLDAEQRAALEAELARSRQAEADARAEAARQRAAAERPTVVPDYDYDGRGGYGPRPWRPVQTPGVPAWAQPGAGGSATPAPAPSPAITPPAWVNPPKTDPTPAPRPRPGRRDDDPRSG